METTQINDKLSVSGQLTVSDVKQLAHDGIKVLICNRPDAEETDQPSFKDIEATAIKNNITFVNIPFSGINVPALCFEQFINVIDNSNDEIHAYCRTGNRCSILWGLSHVRTHSIEDTLEKAQTLGFIYKPIVLEQLQTVREKYLF